MQKSCFLENDFPKSYQKNVTELPTYVCGGAPDRAASLTELGLRCLKHFSVWTIRSNMHKLTQERRDERRSRHPSVQQGQIPAEGSASAGGCEGCSCHGLDGVIRNSGGGTKRGARAQHAPSRGSTESASVLQERAAASCALLTDQGERWGERR